MNIGYVFDENFACCAAVSMTSLMINISVDTKVHFHVFDDGITEESRNNIVQLVNKYKCEVSFYDVNQIVNYLKKLDVHPWRGRYSAYIKLMIEKFLPLDVERFILIDADTIVDGDVSKLETMDLQGHPCAMAFEGVHADYRKISGVGDAALYNTGVIIYDLSVWRKKKVEQRFVEHLKNVSAHYMLPEEDPISIVLKDDIAKLHPKYNFIVQFYLYGTSKYFKRFKWNKMGKNFYALNEVQEAKADVRIYHCIDTFTNRPWNKNNIHPYTELYDKYLNKTPWSAIEKKELKMSLVQKVEYLLRKYLPHRLSIYMYFCAAYLFYTVGAKKFYDQR